MDQNVRKIDKCCNRNGGEDKKENEVQRPLDGPLVKLIIWNIKKAKEKNPQMNLKTAIKNAQARLESCNISSIMATQEEERYVACALLAWQQLGHSNADSLFEFVDAHNANEKMTSTNTSHQFNQINEPTSICSKDIDSSTILKSYSSGPVVRLPIKTSRIVMRVEKKCSSHVCKKSKTKEKEILSKIEAACCLDSGCADRLAKMDTMIKELRNRATMLARREAERVELLERAENAWKDLELGYQRRLTLAHEKEEEITKQIQKLINERNGHKNACKTLANQLKVKGEAAENDRLELNRIEKQLYERACNRMNLSQEVAKIDACLTDHQVKAAQLQRDLQFKEEQARRKKISIENELTCAKALTNEAERALRAELCAIRDQIADVSKSLLEEDSVNARLKKELEDSRKEKKDLTDDLDGCKILCDGRMEGIINELQAKKAKLAEMKDKVFECKCKVPVDASIEVKRTASLAALCKCTPQDKLESCSCTSIRGRLFSNLLLDLFSGLQDEMGFTGSEMPCHLLKCLDDRHNWDRASVVKTNLKNYFSKLLMGEIDIAIATSIEKYHATWVGETCADRVKSSQDCRRGKLSQASQERAIECRAQSLAMKLAEQLFQEKADELTKKAKAIMDCEQSPCSCKPNKTQAAVYPCFVQNTPIVPPFTRSKSPQGALKKAIADVSELRAQIEDLKKDSIKKEDLKLMEHKITKIVKRVSVQEHDNNRGGKTLETCPNENNPTKEQKTKTITYPSHQKTLLNKPTSLKKRLTNDSIGNKKLNKVIVNVPKIKPPKRFGQTYAVNTCLCSPEDSNKINQAKLQITDLVTKVPNMQSDSIDMNKSVGKVETPYLELPCQDIAKTSCKDTEGKACPSKTACFHKVPSNSSIDKLLETLTKWKNDLNQQQWSPKFLYNIQDVCKDGATTNNGIQQVDSQSNIAKVSKDKDLNVSQEINDKTFNKADIITPLNSPSIHVFPEETKPIDQDSGNIKCIVSNGHMDSNNSKSKLQVREVGEEVSEKKSESNVFRTNSKNDNSINGNVYDNKDSINSCKLFAKSAVSEEKGHESEYLPIAKPSEYMAEISLDKSNEEIKCKPTTPKLKNKGRNIRAPIPSISSTKCTATSKCNCSKTSKYKNTYKPFNRKEKPDKQGCIIKFINQEKNKPKKVDVPDKPEGDESNTQLFDNKYDIKFLGVTLTDVNYDKNLDMFENDDSCSCSPNNCLGTGQTLNNMECRALHQMQEDIIKGTNKTKSIRSTKNESIDIPSLKNSVVYKESCIFCDNQTRDETKDLEENTYHLLEEHLKNKFKQFKTEASRKSFCIPVEEEKNIYSTILDRVKQVISESTNNISCKCVDKCDSSQGSWKRAYGLLQEYLKIKINRVQCSCSLGEENKNIFLPGLMEKVCHLIENDFQRLKQLYGLQSNNNSPEKGSLDENNSLEANCDLPLLFLKNKSYKISKPVEKENISSQASPYIGMVMKACDPIQYPTKKIQVTGNPLDILSFDSSFSEQDVEYDKSSYITEFINTNTEPIPKSIMVNSYYVSKTTSHFTPIYSDNFNNTISKENVYKQDHEIKNPLKTINEHNDNVTNEKCGPSLNNNNSDRVDANTSAVRFKQIITNEYIDCSTSYTSDVKTNNNMLLPAPYTGYTIDCSCDQSIGTCVCIKSQFKPNAQINEMWNKYSTTENGVQKMSYILHPMQKIDDSNMIYSSMPGEYNMNILNTYKHTTQEQETEISILNGNTLKDCDISLLGDSDFILKYSKDELDLCNNMTIDTRDDESMTAACSKNIDPLEWNKCFSYLPDEVPSQLKNSIYFPAEFEFSSPEETIIENENSKSQCNCDTVPICHVKMLVKNIESKLANSSCTCDSMAPEVCPVHSK